MKVAVIGANGQLGVDVVEAFNRNRDEVLSLSHSDIELSNADSVSNQLRQLRSQFIVNTAAMHHVENCEKEPAKAFAVNGLGARNLASVAQDIDSAVLQVSTDYVFDGAKKAPYEESDAPMPLNVYGNTKLAGEYYVRSTARKHFVLRTSAVYGTNPCRAKGGLNFVELMLKLAKERGKVRVVDSEFISPTRTTEIAAQIVALSRSDAYGLYHGTAEVSCSWYEFAKEIFENTKTRVVLESAGPNEFPAKVARPTYSVLENRALKNQGLNVFNEWRLGLRDYLLATNRL
jgi:dTDP-4-dehydrorhamnose reductase